MDMKTIQLNTERTVIVPLTPDNAELIFNYYRDNLTHLFQWDAEPAQSYDLDTWLHYADWSWQQFEVGLQYEFIALDLAQENMLALCSFTQVTKAPHWSCELGFSIAQTSQGQGIMHEVLSATTNYVFANLDIHRIMAHYHPDNIRSDSLLKRLGFKIEGRAKSYQQLNGVWCDFTTTALINPNHT